MATRFWTVAVAPSDLPETGDPVEVIRSDIGHGYDAWSRGLRMPIEAVDEFGSAGRQPVAAEETWGTIGLIAILPERLAILRIDS